MNNLQKSKVLLLQWLIGGYELLLFLPLVIAVGVWLHDGGDIWLWTGSLTLYYLTGLIMSILFVHSRQVFLVLAGLIFSGGIAWLISGWNAVGWISWGIGAFLLYRGYMLGLYNWMQLYTGFYYASGLGVYFFAAFFYSYYRLLKPYIPLLTWSGIGCIVVSLLLTNRLQLRQATLSGDKEAEVSVSIRRHNDVFTLSTVVIVMVIAFVRQIKDTMLMVYYTFNHLMRVILDWFFQSSNLKVQPTPPPKTKVYDPVLKGEPSAWALLLEKIVYYLAAIIIFVAAVTLLVFLCIKLWQWLTLAYRWWLQFMKRKREEGSGSGGFVDEKEQLDVWKEVSKNYAFRLKTWFSQWTQKEPKWEELADNREKVRFLYRQFLQESIRKGYSLKIFYTPKETMRDLAQWQRDSLDPAEKWVALYNQVRYGHYKPEDHEVEALRKALANKMKG